MRRVLRQLSLLAALALPASAAAQGSVLERLTLRDDVLGWEGVGKVEIGSDGFCTGTLIATDLVLTAAHCVYDPRGELYPPDRLRFRAAISDGRAVADSPVAQVAAHPGFRPGREVSQDSVRHDAALLRLARPIPAATAAPFAVASPGPRTREVSVVSYAVGREDALSWQRSCDVLGQAEGLLAFDCDVDFGSSGAPVFDRSSGRARIVSIISSGRRDGQDVVAIGMELPALVEDLRGRLRGLPAASAAALPPPVTRLSPGTDRRSIGARFVRP